MKLPRMPDGKKMSVCNRFKIDFRFRRTLTLNYRLKKFVKTFSHKTFLSVTIDYRFRRTLILNCRLKKFVKTFGHKTLLTVARILLTLKNSYLSLLKIKTEYD